MSEATPNPWTGEVEHRQPRMDDGQVETRLAAAAAAFPRWAATPLERRASLLRIVAAALREQAPALAAVITAEMGKLHREAVAEVNKCAGVCEYYATHAAAMLADEPVETEAARSLVVHRPLGCVLAVMPWNFPFWQVFRFLAPTLMAGNVALLKHATNVPRCAGAIAALLHDAGLPDGVFGVLHIDNDQAAAVIADPRVVGVSLTGSERAGRSVAATAGHNLKKVVLELGGSDPFIVLPDADLAAAVTAAAASRFDNAGQTCIAAKRFIVLEEVADAFTAGLVAAAGMRQYGDPMDPATTLAPMARADLREGLHRQVTASVAAGATVLCGSTPVPDSHAGYPATVLDGVRPGMPAFDEELFGPVAAIIRVADVEEAIALANASDYGLGGSVWTADGTLGETVARRLECGAAFVNSVVRSDARLPFGGIKRSGHGRELGRQGLLEFTNTQTVYVA